MNDRSQLTKAGLALAAGAGALTVLGCFGPWLSSDIPGVSEGGLSSDGPVLLVLLALAALPLALHATRGVPRGWLFTSPLLGALMSLVCIVDVADVQDNGLGIVHTGWGLMAATAGSVILAAAATVVVVAAHAGRRAHAAA